MYVNAVRTKLVNLVQYTHPTSSGHYIERAVTHNVNLIKFALCVTGSGQHVRDPIYIWAFLGLSPNVHKWVNYKLSRTCVRVNNALFLALSLCINSIGRTMNDECGVQRTIQRAATHSVRSVQQQFVKRCPETLQAVSTTQ